MDFNKSILLTIDKALRSYTDTVVMNRTWQQLHNTFEIGQLTGANKLALSSKDHRHLRDLVSQHTGIDPLDVDSEKSLNNIIHGSRIDIAKHLPNEKLSGRPVSDDVVLVGSPTGCLRLAGGDITLLPGMTLNCHYSDLRGLRQVVLVENLAVMYHLHQFQWPDGFENSVMLFRGAVKQSPLAVTQAVNFVDEVVCFPDYDPQGLMNSLTQRKSIATILPSAESISVLTARGLNKSPVFAAQDDARMWLTHNAANLPYVERMLRERLALSQEGMLGFELDVVEGLVGQ